MVCMFGCASAIKDMITCNELRAPNSYNIYLYVSTEHDLNENIVKSLEKKTDFSLFQLNHEVAVLQDLEGVGSDGMLLKIDIIGNVRSAFSKRIGIRYQIINNSTREVMFSKVEELSSKLGGEKITIKMAKNIARDVDDVIKCIKKRDTPGS
jgi:hypothetical protein